MKATDFLGNYLSKENVKEPVLVTIGAVESRMLEGAGRDRLILSFEEFRKELVLNSTNLQALVVLHGEDTELWIGKAVVLFVDPTITFAGKRIGGIRLRAPRIPANGTEVEARTPF